MQTYIKNVSIAAGIPEDTCRKAVGVIFALVRAQGHGPKVDALFANMPGAAALADDGVAGGGLVSKMAGGMMGGPLVALARLQGFGLSHDQSKSVMSAALTEARKLAGDKLVREAASNIPGLSGYL